MMATIIASAVPPAGANRGRQPPFAAGNKPARIDPGRWAGRPALALRRRKGIKNYMEYATRIVRPVSPVVPYIGGKRKLAPVILPWIEAVPHRCYAEPFLGMGGVFLQRRYAPPVEVVNDVSKDVVTFFRILQRHFTPFAEMLRYQITARAEFERLADTDPATLTDLERAARFLYLQACSYGGKVAGRTFGVHNDSFKGFDFTRLTPLMDAVHSRLSGVVIENLPYGDFISRYDGDGTLLYLDPPYFECERYYGSGVFGRDDFGRLAEQLAGIKGRFILSLNDHPEVRRIFAGFAIEDHPFKYTVHRGDQRDAVELIITGPPARAWKPEIQQPSLWNGGGP